MSNAVAQTKATVVEPESRGMSLLDIYLKCLVLRPRQNKLRYLFKCARALQLFVGAKGLARRLFTLGS
jgi:hypothetical protein